MIPYILFSVNENCQTAIIFNNLGIYLDFGRDMKEELHISLAKRWRCFHSIIYEWDFEKQLKIVSCTAVS